MESMLSVMQSIMREQTFPCLPFVAYAYMKNMDFNRHVPEAGEVLLEQQDWAIPDFAASDFYVVPRDFIAAAFEFLGSIPQCRQSVQSLQSVPSTSAVQRALAPDRHSAFLLRFQAWLAAGRSSINYSALANWDRLALTVPFWKDAEFCQAEMHFVDDNTNMVHPLVL